MHQPTLFGDAQRATRWCIARRSLYIVPRRDLTGYTIRMRWSQKLGLQLDHVFMSYADAARTVERIYAAGFITMNCWKRIYNPRWSTSCRTLSN